MGPAGRRLRQPRRTRELPRVRRPPPPARSRHRRPAARRGLRLRPRARAGRRARRPLRRHRRLAPPGRRRPRPLPRRRRARRRHARAAVGRRQLRRGHQLPRDLGHHSGRGVGGPPGAEARRASRSHRVGPHQGLDRGVGAGAVPARLRGEGRQPGSDGQPRPTRSRRGPAERGRVRGRPPRGDPLRLGVPRPGDLRPRPRRQWTGVRGDPGGRRGGLPGPCRRGRRGARARRVAAAGRDRGGRLPGPQACAEPAAATAGRAEQGRIRRGAGVKSRRGTVVRRGRRGSRLRHERHPDVGAPARRSSTACSTSRSRRATAPG